MGGGTGTGIEMPNMFAVIYKGKYIPIHKLPKGTSLYLFNYSRNQLIPSPLFLAEKENEVPPVFDKLYKEHGWENNDKVLAMKKSDLEEIIKSIGLVWGIK
mgnify:CR=1 FL=1